MEVVSRDGEAVHLFAVHLDPLLVLGWIDFAGDGQAGCGRGCRNQFDDSQSAGQGPATPVLRNVTEEPVLASRAGESHPHALLEPYVNLSIHTAPDVRPLSCRNA